MLLQLRLRMMMELLLDSKSTNAWWISKITILSFIRLECNTSCHAWYIAPDFQDQNSLLNWELLCLRNWGSNLQRPRRRSTKILSFYSDMESIPISTSSNKCQRCSYSFPFSSFQLWPFTTTIANNNLLTNQVCHTWSVLYHSVILVVPESTAIKMNLFSTKLTFLAQ